MTIPEVLTPPKTIAVVGLSDKPDRPSFIVARYLQQHGFTIVPVNPMVQEVLGQKVYPSLKAIPAELHIDVVDIFRQPEHVPAIVQEVLDLGWEPIIWMQEGVISADAKKLAAENNLFVIMDKCMKKEHQALNQL